MTTPEDSAAVSMSTARIIADLEYMAEQDDRNGWAGRAQILHDAIDRLIVLDNARQDVAKAARPRLTPSDETVDFLADVIFTNGKEPAAVKESLTPHPRELALHQDAKRGNFRHTPENGK